MLRDETYRNMHRLVLSCEAHNIQEVPATPLRRWRWPQHIGGYHDVFVPQGRPKDIHSPRTPRVVLVVLPGPVTGG